MQQSAALSNHMDLLVFQQAKTMRFGDLSVAEHPEFSGKTTEEVRRNGQFLFMTEPTEIVQADDTLIVMGPNL